jgi:hypothetical protein
MRSGTSCLTMFGRPIALGSPPATRRYRGLLAQNRHRDRASRGAPVDVWPLRRIRQAHTCESHTRSMPRAWRDVYTSFGNSPISSRPVSVAQDWCCAGQEEHVMAAHLANLFSSKAATIMQSAIKVAIDRISPRCWALHPMSRARRLIRSNGCLSPWTHQMRSCKGTALPCQWPPFTAAGPLRAQR